MSETPAEGRKRKASLLPPESAKEADTKATAEYVATLENRVAQLKLENADLKAKLPLVSSTSSSSRDEAIAKALDVSHCNDERIAFLLGQMIGEQRDPKGDNLVQAQREIVSLLKEFPHLACKRHLRFNCYEDREYEQYTKTSLEKMAIMDEDEDCFPPEDVFAIMKLIPDYGKTKIDWSNLLKKTSFASINAPMAGFIVERMIESKEVPDSFDFLDYRCLFKAWKPDLAKEVGKLFPYVTELKLDIPHDWGRVVDEPYFTWLEILSTSSKLTSLKLPIGLRQRHDLLSVERATELINNVLKANTKLTSLSFFDKYWHTASYQDTTSPLPGIDFPSNIESLTLDGCYFDSEFLKKLARMKNLRTLELHLPKGYRCRFGCIDISEMLVDILQSNTLKFLEIS